MNFYQELKKRTEADHKATEKVMEPSPFSPEFGLAHYKTYLLAHFLFYQYYESRLAASGIHPLFGTFCDPCRSELLSNDLQKLKLGTAAILEEDTWYKPGLASATGHLYVIVGSGMGGKIIGKELLSRADISQTGATDFIRSQQQFDGHAWKQLTALIDNLGEEEKQGKEMIEASRLSFRLFAKCYAIAQQNSVVQYS